MNDKTLMTVAMRIAGKASAKKRKERMGKEGYRKLMSNLGKNGGLKKAENARVFAS